MSLSEEQYLSKISQLENEIEYLHGLLDNAGIFGKMEFVLRRITLSSIVESARIRDIKN